MDTQNQIFIIILLLFYTVLISYVGYRNRKSKTSEDYFLASRSLPPWLLAITFIASWWGGGSAIDLVDQAHEQGISSVWIYGVSVLIATFLMYLFSGGIRRITTLSQPELMEQRYDSRSAFMLAIFIIIFMVIAAAVQVIVIGNFFNVFFGLDYTYSAIAGTLLVLMYSFFGGFKGVVVTDLVQFVFFLIASVFLFGLTIYYSGGMDIIYEKVINSPKEGYTSFFHNIENNLAYVITFGTSWMIQANVWQRISASRTPKDARKMMAISFFVFIPLYLITTITGMLSTTIFDTVPEGGIVSNLLMQLDMPIISGLIFVGLCSAIMSTMDSMLNTGALSLTVDIYKKHIYPNKPASHYVLIGRLSTVIVAAAALFIGVKIKSVLTISWIGADFIATGVFVPLVLGFLWKKGTSKAAFASMVFGLVFSSYNLVYALGIDIPIAWEIASTKQAIVGVVSSLVIFVSVSLLTQSKAELNKAETFMNTARVLKPRTKPRD